MKKTLNVPNALDKVIDEAAGEVEQAALVAISARMALLFESQKFEADVLKASGKKKLSQAFLDDVADHIKERALKDIARIFKEGLY